MVSAKTPGELGCHSCNCLMSKAAKVHKGQRYCARCHKQLFERRLCPGCGNYSQLPVHDPSARCNVCERARPCCRCGKTEFKTSMQSEYGPVCKTCLPYFRTPEACETCGKASQRIAISTVTGLRSCQKCREPGQATCPGCRRHRLLVADDQGQMLCKLCSAEVERVCESCAERMPAGRGKKCERCYWTALHHSRVQFNLNGLDDPARLNFQAFAGWLLERVGPHKAALTIDKHYCFFKEINSKWGAPPRYEVLLNEFGAGKLRRSELAMRWLTDSGQVRVAACSRERHSEERRVESMLEELHDPWPKQLLLGYYKVLRGRLDKQEIDLRSVRLALRPAVAILKVAKLSEGQWLTMKHLEAFWRGSPGQVAAATGFVGYLKRTYGVHLKSKPDKHWLLQARRSKAEHDLLTLLKARTAANFESRWIAKALAYFHDLSRVSYKKLSYSTASVDSTTGFNVIHGALTLWVPSADSFQPALV